MTAAALSPRSTAAPAYPAQLALSLPSAPVSPDIAADVLDTMALWQHAGLRTADIWFALTGEHRASVAAERIYTWMTRWLTYHNHEPAPQPVQYVSREGTRKMSRLRFVHPSQWTDEDFVACSPAARLLLLGLRSEADDRGVFEWRSRSLKMRLLPADQVDIDELLDELVANRQIARFEIDSATYGVCLVWGQKPRRPSYRFPEPPADLLRRDEFVAGGIPDNVGIAPDNVGSAPAKESEEEREYGGEVARPRAKAPPQDLPKEWQEEASRQRPDADLGEQWGRFRRHFGERPDRITKGGWLNWIAEAKPAPGPVPATTTAPSPAAPCRPPWFDQHPIEWRAAATQWVEHGAWRPKLGPQPGENGCRMPSRLAAWAVAQRLEKLGEAKVDRTLTAPKRPAKAKRPDPNQREAMLPIAGGAAKDTPAAATNEPAERYVADPAELRKTA